MKKVLLFISLIFICCGLYAQEKGTVTVIKDPLIDTLIQQRARYESKPAAVTVPAVKPAPAVVSQYGYRVQIFYGSDRREVFNQQAKFRALYPKYNSYISFKSPNYYLRVGDFRTRLEAQGFLNELKSSFPTLFIFREKINAPELD